QTRTGLGTQPAHPHRRRTHLVQPGHAGHLLAPRDLVEDRPPVLGDRHLAGRTHPPLRRAELPALLRPAPAGARHGRRRHRDPSPADRPDEDLAEVRPPLHLTRPRAQLRLHRRDPGNRLGGEGLRQTGTVLVRPRPADHAPVLGRRIPQRPGDRGGHDEGRQPMSKRKPGRPDRDRYGRGLNDPLPSVEPDSQERVPVPERPEPKKFNAPLWAGAIVVLAVVGVLAFNIFGSKDQLTVDSLNPPAVAALDGGSAGYPPDSKRAFTQNVKFVYLPSPTLAALCDRPGVGGLVCTLSATNAPLSVASINPPAVAALNGGSAVSPPDSKRAFTENVKFGYLPAPTLAALGDGTVVAADAETAAESMGLKKGLDELTVDEFLDASITPPREDTESGEPITWDGLVDELGGDTVFLPEITSAELAGPALDTVTEAGLEDSTIVRTDDAEVARAAADAGVDAMFTGDVTASSEQSLSEAGFTALAVDADAAADRTGGELDVWATGVEDEKQLDELADAGVFGALSTNPYEVLPSEVKTD